MFNLYTYKVHLLIAIAALCRTNGELYRSISDVVHLLETQKAIIDNLQEYVNKEQQRLTTLKTYLQTFEQEHHIAVENVTSYLGNPINAFKLIKRLTVDIKDIDVAIANGKEYISTVLEKFMHLDYPTEVDLKGVAQALSALQVKLDLDVKELADGKINSVVTTAPMSPSDCFELGRSLYNVKDYANALPWMLVALEKLRAEPEANHMLATDIIEYISTYNLTDANLRP